MKILILSCSTGGGHNACAKYIKEELDENNIKCDVSDFYDIFNNKGKNLSSKIYLTTLKGKGNFFRGVYKIGELYSETSLTSPVYLVNKIHKKKLYKYIKENNYDLVITTHLFPSLTLTAINKKKKEKINFIEVATDYECTPFYEETKPNYFIIPKGLEERFLRKKIEKSILISLGIPISSRFIRTAKNIRKELNIKNEKIVLIMLGSMGFGNVDSIISNLLKEENIKVIVICGSNEKLYKELQKINDSNLIVYGFVKNINDLIYSSDVVLTKPGGLSSTEVASLRKPLIHINPIPGVETYNTDFFKRNKMSLSAKTIDEIVSNTLEILNNSQLYKELISNQKKLVNNESAKDLMKLIKEKF